MLGAVALFGLVLKAAELLVARPLFDAAASGSLAEPVQKVWNLVNETIPIEAFLSSPWLRGALGTAGLLAVITGFFYHINIIDVLHEEIRSLQLQSKGNLVLESTDAAAIKNQRRTAPAQFQEARPIFEYEQHHQRRSKMLSLIANGPTFVVLYLVCMLPTYFLPYLGSNSLGLNTAAVLGGGVYGPQFWLHLILLIILCVLAWREASMSGKRGSSFFRSWRWCSIWCPA